MDHASAAAHPDNARFERRTRLGPKRKTAGRKPGMKMLNERENDPAFAPAHPDNAALLERPNQRSAQTEQPRPQHGKKRVKNDERIATDSASQHHRRGRLQHLKHPKQSQL